jgi:transcriptional regulator with XRE-family HTH domain
MNAMALALHRLLGMDPNDPKVVAAAQDAEAYASLVESLVVLRRRRGLTQLDVAKRMETTQSTVSDFESVGGDARYSTLQRYARAVGARLHSMVDLSTSGLAPTWQPAAEVPVSLVIRPGDQRRTVSPWTEVVNEPVTAP